MALTITGEVDELSPVIHNLLYHKQKAAEFQMSLANDLKPTFDQHLVYLQLKSINLGGPQVTRKELDWFPSYTGGTEKGHVVVISE